MTCHIAMLGIEGAVMFSDSQGSTLSSEVHGLQKQCAGKDFLLGGSGHGPIVTALLDEITKCTENGTLDSGGVEVFVKTFISIEVAANAQSAVQFLLVLPSALRLFIPALFTGFRPMPNLLASIGSGSEFVDRAFHRNLQLGISHGTETLADTVVAIEDFSDVANESLTVDDRFTVGVLRAGRTYLMGHRDIGVTFAPAKIGAAWRSTVGPRFDEILAIVRTIRGEIREARRQAASIRTGTLTSLQTSAMHGHSSSIQSNRLALTQKLNDYCDWYDHELGRVPSTTSTSVPPPAPSTPPAAPSVPPVP